MYYIHQSYRIPTHFKMSFLQYNPLTSGELFINFMKDPDIHIHV